jgi:lipase chaperone LimK
MLGLLAWVWTTRLPEVEPSTAEGAALVIPAATEEPAGTADRPAPTALIPAAVVDSTDSDSSPGLPPAVLARLAESSLRGTEPDGGVRFSSDGRLIVDADLRRQIEWWLSLLGEMPLVEIRSLFEQSLANAHAPAQAAAALAFFDRWVDYLAAADAQLPDGSTAQRLDALSALRRQWFGADAETLFGDEERYTRHVLARQELLRDSSLTPEERQQQLALLDVDLSPEQRAMRAETIDPLLASEQTSQFDALDVPPAQRQVERAALFGPEAAERLALLDAERAAWDTRVAMVRAQQQAWAADTTLDPAQREARLQSLLDVDFSDSEQRRVRALLSLRGQAGE